MTFKELVELLKKKENGKRPKSRNRKKWQIGSIRRLYTDENPKDTVRIKFATPADARATVKVKNIKKPMQERYRF